MSNLDPAEAAMDRAGEAVERAVAHLDVYDTLIVLAHSYAEAARTSGVELIGVQQLVLDKLTEAYSRPVLS